MSRRMSYATHREDDLVLGEWGRSRLNMPRPSCYRDDYAVEWTPQPQASGSGFVPIVFEYDESSEPVTYPSEKEYFGMLREEQLLPLRSHTPLHSFRSNLTPDKGYITSFPYGGLSTQLIEAFKVVHLGKRLQRAAILPELKAEDDEGGDVPLSTFFDLRSFAYLTGVKIAEWKDVKIPDASGADGEKLSCWGWRDERPLDRYNVKTSFWPPPGQLEAPTSVEHSLNLSSIETIASEDQTAWLDQCRERYYTADRSAPPPPSEQLLCFENLYFVPSIKSEEGRPDSTFPIEELVAADPIWAIGRHLKYSAHLNSVADELVASLLGSKNRAFIAIHIRGELEDEEGKLVQSTKAMISAFASAEKVVQDEVALQRRPWSSRSSLPVLFTTDSDDPLLVKRLHRLGWVFIDHREFATVTRFGGWWPSMLDAVLLSRARGLVGTQGSTFSTLAARRVESWNDGVTRLL